jgi:CRISPR-associated protein Csb2
MFALALRYLNGWAMASADGARKETPEWPPHPDRVFMALAAAWFETDQDAAEGAALRWLQALPPPAINASAYAARSSVVSFVPVNDARLGRKAPDSSDPKKLRDAGLAVLPEHRSRQARGFPVAVPRDPCVRLIWADVDASEHRPALERLAGKVTHVGHTASFVQAWVDEEPPEPTLVPAQGAASHRLRVAVPGRLDALEKTYNRAAVIAHADLEAARTAAKGKERNRLQRELEARFPAGAPVTGRPAPARWMGYGEPAVVAGAAMPQSLFDSRLVVLRLRGQRLDLPATLRLTEALRGAILAACAEPIAQWVSGHASDGSPSRDPHLAILPLPFVGAQHADGHLQGVALAIPNTVSPSDVSAALQALLWTPDHQPARIHLFAGRWFECTAQLEQSPDPAVNLRSATWTGPARRWASVTPVVLDRHCDGAKRWTEAEEMVKAACERIGLPRPGAVALHAVSALAGVPHGRDFPLLMRKNGGGARQHVHAQVLFDEPVRGPVLIGAGRFRGYGLLRPLPEEQGHD